MEFGVPKEVRDGETRVGLTPPGVFSLVRAGHTVYIEQGAGVGAGFDNDEYERAGAQIVYSAEEAYGRAETVVKVARPTAKEHLLFRPEQTIFSFLYLTVSSPDLLQAFVENQITAIAYEMIQEDDGRLPVLLPTSEVAGRLSPIIAGRLLMGDRGGRGILLNGIPGVPPAVVAIIGAGVAGINAARAFLGMNAQVIVLDRDLRQLHYVDDLFNGSVTTMISNQYNLKRAVTFADVLVGCVQVPGQRAPILVSREMVREMRPGSVIIDLAIINGGCIETSRPTTLHDQTFVAEGIIHHCVPNVTASVARTASHALTHAALPCLKAIGSQGLSNVVRTHSPLARGVNLYQGKIAHPRIAAALGREVEVELPTGVNS
ncbi:MAG TPA: alanine dehydrogenase [Anaerolineae bacterium]|nr:alanine dehydrogenase [Anaerolineae bacterium]MCB0222680.1 alanine dehydrogenase [Anaerolineae bacterium]MCB9107725.1 alanine dehydrogenase [Anaerolineales bacterium]HRV90605.1 alanine dehydrogenase [Anaerolineae bacterium]